MLKMEFHPAEGGLDAELFAQDLANAVAKHASMRVITEGRVICAVTDHRL